MRQSANVYNKKAVLIVVVIISVLAGLLLYIDRIHSASGPVIETTPTSTNATVLSSAVDTVALEGGQYNAFQTDARINNEQTLYINAKPLRPVEVVQPGETWEGSLGNELTEKERAYNQERESLSLPMATLHSACSSCTDLLLHIRLMTGNRFSDDDLFNIVKMEDPEPTSPDELTAIYVTRMALKSISPPDYEALKHYEQNVLGRLLEPENVSSLVNTYEFQSYKEYLIEVGEIEDFCQENPSNLSCMEKLENTST